MSIPCDVVFTSHIAFSLTESHSLDLLLHDQVEDGNGKGKSTTFDQAAPDTMRYLQRVVDEILAVLFDSRRQSCHGLVLNNFVACSGFKQLLAKFQAACQCLFHAVDKQEAEPQADSAAAKTTGKEQPHLSVLMLLLLLHASAVSVLLLVLVFCPPYLVHTLSMQSSLAVAVPEHDLADIHQNNAILCRTCTITSAISEIAATYHVALTCRRASQACRQYARRRPVHCQA